MLAADDGARVIAGGQTLVPLMAMRLARPTRYAKYRHFDFLLDSSGACRSCVALVLPPGEAAPEIMKPDWPSMMDRVHLHVPGSPPMPGGGFRTAGTRIFFCHPASGWLKARSCCCRDGKNWTIKSPNTSNRLRKLSRKEKRGNVRQSGH